jgi:regulatory protein
MGDLLRFPDRGAQEGAEVDSAPSRVLPAPTGVDAPAEEPKWAVPGVDDAGPAPERESTRSSRRAENVAIATLTRHDASEGEVRAKLVAKGLEEDDVEAELERLRRVGLIDDAAFAARVVASLRERKGLGDQAIRSTLRGRLVPQGVIDEVLVEQAEDEETTEARLQEAADDRARRLGSLTRAVADRRLTAYLMRKGYSGSSVRTAVRAALDSAGI